MFQENYFKIISDFFQTAPFGQPRNYSYPTYHSGNDYSSGKQKKQDIYNLLAGQIAEYGREKYAGKHVTVRHSFKFLNGVDDIFYSCYKHLSSIDPIVPERYNLSYDPGATQNNFIPPGEIIGKMGNTGYCMTKEKRKWRLLTAKEQANPKCNKGVHCHHEFFQITEKNRITPLLQNFLKMKWAYNEPDYYFFRFGTLYINPDLIMSYARFLMDRS